MPVYFRMQVKTIPDQVFRFLEVGLMDGDTFAG
jgi:hypothetical protein